MLVNKTIKSIIAFLCVYSFAIFSFVNAQTSRLPKTPKGFTIDLSNIDKDGFSKDKIGRALKKESKLLYLDSLAKIKNSIKINKNKIDSLEKLSSNLNLSKSTYADYIEKEFDKILKSDSLISAFKLKGLDTLAYIRKKYDVLFVLNDSINRIKNYQITDSSLVNIAFDSLLGAKIKKDYSTYAKRYNKLSDSLAIHKDSLQLLDSMYGNEFARQAQVELLKKELLKQSQQLESQLSNVKEIGYIQQEQVGFDKISKDLESTQKKLESIRNYENLKEGIEDNQEVLLKELGGAEANILKSTQEVLALNQKAAFSKLSNILGINKYNNPYSLKSDSLKKRVKLGGNFQIVQFENPFIIDLSPRVGFRLNKVFTAGVELNYRAAIGNVDTLQSKAKVPETMLGYRLYLNSFITHGFFAHAEFESMRVAENEIDKATAETSFTWKSGWLVGIGKQYHLASKVNGSITLLYSINNDKNKLYTNPFQLRFGFDLK